MPALYLSDGQLSPDDEHYLRKVHRLRDGHEFLALDGCGGARRATLTASGFSLGDEAECVAEARLRLHLYLALSKGERFDRTVEKLAELGVDSLTPLVTRRTQIRTPGENKRRRWHRIALSGSALALRGRPMRVAEPLSFEQALEQARSETAALLFSEGAPALDGMPKEGSLALFIGPEGGFDPEELEQARQAGLSLAGLGPRNLRVETAAVAAATLSFYLSGDLG